MTYFKKELHSGYNCYIDADTDDMATMMDVGLVVLEAGESYTWQHDAKEAALLLFEGDVTFSWNGQSADAQRKETISCPAWCLHVCRNTTVTVTARNHAEIYLQATLNDGDFAPKLYTPADIHVQRAGSNGELLGCMRRDIKTFFDYENAPYSNMVLGEVLSHPGKWSSYPPHFHPQPEVYFYRFDYPQGFGAGFANDEVYKIEHNGLAVITHGFHSQTTAPGYAECYAWGIRHLAGDPWQKTRIDEPEHAWLWEADANEHIFQES